MFETMMYATKFNLSNGGGNPVGDWCSTAAVAFRPVFLYRRLDDSHENRAGECNILRFTSGRAIQSHLWQMPEKSCEEGRARRTLT